jgi:CubicO group peptidase (beta-lactamase class C family)
MDAWPPRNTNDTGPIRRSTRRESHRLGGFSHPGQASFGLGWGVSTFGQSRDVLVSHSGSTWTWGASVRMLVERGIGIVALGNSGGSLPLSRFTLKALQQIDRVLNADGVARPRRTRARKSPVRRR